MKKRFLLLVLWAFAINFSWAQTKDELEVRAALAEQDKAWNAGDINGFMQTYWQSDSLLFTGQSGPTYGWQTTLENYKKRYPDTAAMGKLQFDILQLKSLSSEYYFLLGKWHLQRTIGDVGGYFTLLFKKINGRWVIVADHTS